MSVNQLDMMDLDSLMSVTESDAFTEEQINADENFKLMQNYMENIKHGTEC